MGERGDVWHKMETWLSISQTHKYWALNRGEGGGGVLEKEENPLFLFPKGDICLPSGDI